MEWPAAVPVTVIVSERLPFETEADARWWRDAHAQFARRADNRPLVTAERSSHDVVYDRPDVIMDTIIGLLGIKREVHSVTF